MLIETQRFGKINVKNKQIIIFSEGIIGFNSLKRYVLVDVGDDSPFSWLQSMDEPSICFLVVDPVLFKSNYKVPLGGEDLSGLQADGIDGLLTVVIVTVPEDLKLMTANLKGPIIINPDMRIAKQLVLNSEDYITRHSIFSV